MAKSTPKRKSISPTFDKDTYSELVECAERYGKDSMARVVIEIVKWYLPWYKKVEEAALEARTEQQSALGKASAPATTERRVARKSA